VPDLTVEEYLASEQDSEIRHELIGGQLMAMSGSSKVHNLIAGNIYTRLRIHLRGSPCQAFISDIKARIEPIDDFYYPDVMVTCDQRDDAPYYNTYPCLLVEVLSQGTKKKDRGEKMWSYLGLDSLREYVMIAQDKIRIEVYRRDAQGKWRRETLGPNDELRFESLPNGPLTMTMDEVYEGTPLSSR
jgi:Uma2 family endonuclease